MKDLCRSNWKRNLKS